MLAAAEHLANHIQEAPVWIVPCLEGAMPTRTSGSSIYPAVQNMLLAARALGLGGICSGPKRRVQTRRNMRNGLVCPAPNIVTAFPRPHSAASFARIVT